MPDNARKATMSPAKKSLAAAKKKPAKKTKAAAKPKPSKKPTKATPVKIDTPKDRAKLKVRNLEAIKQGSAQLYEQLVDYTPQSELVFENGQPDIIFQGNYFYDHDYKEHLRRHLKNFWRAPERLTLTTLQPDSFDDTAGRFLHNLLQRADEKEIVLHQWPTENKSFYLLVLGLGLGGHLMELVEKTECKALLICDPNLELAYHSLEVFDWEALFDAMREREGIINFSFDNNADNLALAIRNWLRATNPMCVDGATYFYHYANPVFTSAMKTLGAEVNLILSGLGFFYDETLMIKNTHKNLYSGKERVFMRPDDPYLDIPVFVIGNGPSLDNDLPFIRENQDKAIIISSGSSLRPLLVNGITPDFQMETENQDVKPLVSQVSKDYDLSPIHLVTSTTVDPSAIPYFKKVLYYFRGSLTPYPVFCDTPKRCLTYPNPTVTNASLSLAQEAGFRHTYLFGVDMGVKKGGRDHSKDAYQYTKGAITREDTYDISVPANFGGISMCSEGLFWTLNVLGHAIAGFGGRFYYNCSDGAKIEHTIPMPSKSISLPEVGKDKKQEAVEQIAGYFPVFSRQEFDGRWNDKKMIKNMQGFLDTIAGAIDETKDFSEKNYLTRLMGLLDPVVAESPEALGSAVLFRGTIFQMFIAFEYYLNRLSGKDQIKTYEKIAREEFSNVLKYLSDTCQEEFGTLSKDAKAALAKGR